MYAFVSRSKWSTAHVSAASVSIRHVVHNLFTMSFFFIQQLVLCRYMPSLRISSLPRMESIQEGTCFKSTAYVQRNKNVKKHHVECAFPFHQSLAARTASATFFHETSVWHGTRRFQVCVHEHERPRYVMQAMDLYTNNWPTGVSYAATITTPKRSVQVTCVLLTFAACTKGQARPFSLLY